MGAFTSEWLGLREAADHAARSRALVRDLVPGAAPVRILDLACGTGSNARFLIPLIPAPQEWRLVDHDDALLAAAVERLDSWARSRGLATTRRRDGLELAGNHVRCRMAIESADLAPIGDAGAVASSTLAGLFAGRSMVTASALLDLVSDAWVTNLAALCHRERAAVLFALTFDGRFACKPEEPEDELVRTLVLQHQRTDKGFGPALGPDGTECAARRFAERGYAVRREQSDWVLAPEMRQLQRELVEGWASAAAEIDPAALPILEPWRVRRLAHIEEGQSRILVGHEDLAAWLP